MKNFLCLLFLIACVSQAFTQESPPSYFASLIKAQEGQQINQLAPTNDAVTAAKMKYTATVQSVLADKGYTSKGDAQVSWMTDVVPNLAFAIDAPKQRASSIKKWADAFSEAYGISKKGNKAIRKSLNSYSTAYFQAIEGKRKENILPVPPPPPPAQQHH